MSAMDMLRYLSRRELNTLESGNDPLVEMLKKDEHLSRSDVIKYRGQKTVEPFILAEALYFLGNFKGEDYRRTNESAVVHFANTEARPKYWKLGFSNDAEERIVLIYMHDLGEDKSNGKVAGNYAVVRVPAAVFGQKYYEPLLALTNIRDTIYKQFKGKVRELLEHPTPDDITRFATDRNGVGSLEDQVAAYNELTRSIDFYDAKIPTFGWEVGKDQEKVMEFLNKVRNHILDLRHSPISEGTILVHSENLFGDFQTYAHSDGILTLKPGCILDGGESPLMHNLDHMQYSNKKGGYLEDLLAYAIEQANAKNPLANDTILVKIQEDTDNVRKEGEKTAYRNHKTYYRAIDIIDMGKRYIAHVKQIQKPEDYRDIELALIFLKEQLLIRVIKDFGQAQLEVDRDYITIREVWYPQQFDMIRTYVGRETDERVNEQLRKSNPELYPHYKRLTEIVQKEDKRTKFENLGRIFHLF